MKLIVMRHGQTDYNVKGLVQGKTDICLNKEGIKQVKKAKERIKNDFDICISSPLKRALETAKIITDAPIITDSRLSERGMGELEGQTHELYDKNNFWDYKLNNDMFGVEKVQDLFARVNDFLKDIKKKYEGKKVLIISHGATIRTLYFCINGFKENENFLNLYIPNTAIFEFEI